jgi:hypothetical protein
MKYEQIKSVSQSYGLSESTTYDTIKWIEDTLIKHPDLALPGRKALFKNDREYEIVLIDATETPIERPKKELRTKNALKTETTNKNNFIQEKRKGIP